MGTRPRLAVLVYGSLLDPAVLGDLFETLEGRVWPVTVQGFERICNQAASWRATDADQRAVLNVVRAETAWCNGLVVTDLKRAEFEAFKERERGYRLVEVDPDHVDPYPPGDVDTDRIGTAVPPLGEQDLVLVTTGTRVDHDIAPIQSYLEDCFDGASQWGESFLADFEATTETNTGADLTTYRSD